MTRSRPAHRISLGVGGKQANSRTFVTGLSADGRRVLLSSDAANLVAGDTGGATDVFVRTPAGP
jgi:hypothetical protein